MGKLLGVLVILAIDVPILILRGYILSKLWNWFIVPLGAIPLNIAHAIGISVLLSFFLLGIAREYTVDNLDPKNRNRTWWESALSVQIGAVIGSLWVWVFGAIIHSFM